MKLFIAALVTPLALASAPWGGQVAIDVTKMKIDTLEDVGITGTMHFKGLEGVSLGGSYKVKSDAKLVPDKIKIGSSFEVGGRFVPDLNLDSIIDVDIAGTGVGLDLVVKPKGSKSTTLLASLDSTSLLTPRSVELRQALNLGPSHVLTLAPKLNPRKGFWGSSYKANLKSGKSTLSVAGELNDKEGTTVKATYEMDDSNKVALQQKPFKTATAEEGGAEAASGPTFSWAHALTKGSIAAAFTPKKKVEVVWTDPGLSGAWVTTASVPLQKGESSSLSFKRTINF